MHIVQCPNGHIYEASTGSELEKRWVEWKRWHPHAIAPMMVSDEECSACLEYWASIRRDIDALRDSVGRIAKRVDSIKR